MLEVIQEATTVDDTTVQALRKQQLSREKTTQSVMEGKTIDATAADLRRVRSANVSRDYGKSTNGIGNSQLPPCHASFKFSYLAT